MAKGQNKAKANAKKDMIIITKLSFDKIYCFSNSLILIYTGNIMILFPK